MQVSNVGSSTSQASSTNSLNNSGRDGLVIGSQLLAPHRETGAAIASLPQVCLHTHLLSNIQTSHWFIIINVIVFVEM